MDQLLDVRLGQVGLSETPSDSPVDVREQAIGPSLPDAEYVPREKHGGLDDEVQGPGSRMDPGQRAHSDEGHVRRVEQEVERLHASFTAVPSRAAAWRIASAFACTAAKARAY